MSNISKTSRNSVSIADIGEKSVQPAPETKKTTQTTTTTTTTTESTMETVQKHFCSPEIWIFIVIIIVIIVLCFFIAAGHMEWYDQINKWNWFANYWVLGVFFVIILIIMAYAAFLCYNYSEGATKAWVLMSFIAAVLLIFAWFVVLFNVKSFINAFWAALVLLFVTIWQTVLAFYVDARFGYCMLPYLILVIAMAGMSWHFNDMNQVDFTV